MLLLCAARAFAADAPAARRLSADDLYRVQDVSDPNVSPDGLWVAYVVTTNDREADEARSAIWMVSWDGSQRLAMTAVADGTGKPRWSPDGRYLAFVANPSGSDTAQIMVLDRRGGDARQVTSASGDIGEYSWAPDGKRMAFTMKQGDAGKTPKPIVIDALHFKDDADGYLRQHSARHLYLLDVESKHVEALTSDANFNEDLPTWSADGRQVAFIRTREKGADADGREDLAVVEPVAGAAPRTVVRPYAPNTQRLAWSPDGTLIAYLQGLEPKFNAYMQDRLAVVPAGGGVPRPLTDKLDRAVTSFAFAADSASISPIASEARASPRARLASSRAAFRRAAPPSASGSPSSSAESSSRSSASIWVWS